MKKNWSIRGRTRLETNHRQPPHIPPIETIRRVPQSTSAISSIVPELRQETNTALLLPAQVVRATLGRSPHVRMQAKWNLARLCASYEIQEASNEVVERESSS
jgi:hypothetical protein